MNNFEFSEKMKARTKTFAVQMVKFYKTLPKTDEARVLGRQVLRSGTSVAANYRAVCRAKSQADFISKLGTVVEEADETLLWLELFEEAEVCAAEKLRELKHEADELLRIFSSSLATAKLDNSKTHELMNCLILVDIQNDFLPGGALAVPDGDKVIPISNKLQAVFPLVVATQDWHPSNHGSFAASHPGKNVFEQIELNGLPQTLWPIHCVQNTKGAELAAALNREHITKIFPKGTDEGIDSYSGLFDNGHRKSTGLGEWLKAQGVTEVFVCGLATDYCVKFTALDAAQMGFKTHFIEDASRGVNLRPDDVKNAIAEMKRAGIAVVQSAELLQVGGNV